MAKALTLRLEDSQAEDIEDLALVKGNAVVEELRDAVTAHLQAHLSDVEVQEALREFREQKRKLAQAIQVRRTQTTKTSV